MSIATSAGAAVPPNKFPPTTGASSPPPDDNDWRMINKKELAKMIGYSSRHINSAVVQGYLPPPVRIGKKSPRWIVPEVIEWLRRKRAE